MCREIGVSEATLSRWRRDYGAMTRSEARELKRLREENSKLKTLLGQSELEKAALKELSEESSKPEATPRRGGLPHRQGAFTASFMRRSRAVTLVLLSDAHQREAAMLDHSVVKHYDLRRWVNDFADSHQLGVRSQFAGNPSQS
ncbi:transposase [Corynebacterium marquesiae]|uniref:transposase n=1 Tax=Corynebacterium marquesiae TaxID=2913503 RepID=UPI0038D085B7